MIFKIQYISNININKLILNHLKLVFFLNILLNLLFIINLSFHGILNRPR